jgi:eukaryotic-like serine/threonine-protein kinase
VTDAVERLRFALADRYRIERELGQGGMATVYLAHDIKHDRRVAIKVLRPELAAVIGAERFLSEIKTTANLQHPHILPLFDSGIAVDSAVRRLDGSAGDSPAAESPSRRVAEYLFYVMPFIDGESLRELLNREKQLPIADAVRIATEVASALDYAHRHNVIHRDIKPENILLHDGRALVADFGIALAASKAGGARMTETGMSLGTPTYMSPEQAMGEREITARSDVYALGCVTYEMLLGEPPFTGPTAQSIVAKVVTEKPASLSARRDTVPPAVEDAVLSALAKLPADRFGTAAEFASALAGHTTRQLSATAIGRAAGTPRQRGAPYLRLAAPAALTLLAVVAGIAIGRRGSDPGSVGRTDVVRATLALGDSVSVRAIGNQRLAISPSGRRVVFVGAGGTDAQLWLRELSQPVSHPLPDTEGAFAPFFSPDGESVGFFTAKGGHLALKVITFTGGVPRTVVQDSVAPFGGADWGDDGRIYFTSSRRGLARVASSGGAVTEIAQPDSTVASGVREIDYPDVLPGSRYALVMLWLGSIGSNHIGLVDLATGALTDLTAGSYPRYVEPGYLAIGVADGRVLVAPFDPRHGRLTGEPVPMLQGVQEESGNGTLQFAVSATGTIVYQRRTGAATGLVWVDRGGRQTPVDTAIKGAFQYVALSPDGRQIALNRTESGESQVWVKQLASGAFSRLSFDVGSADRPVWTPDGSKVAFLGTRNGLRTAWMRRADGSDSLQRAVPGSTRLDEIAFDPLGRYTVLRTEGTGLGSRRLVVVRNGVDTVPRPLVQSQFDNFAPAISPDGRWLAYASNESGTSEVYVRPFPNVDSARFAISAAGGFEPVWRRDGTELFFRGPRGEMFTTPVRTGPRFEHGAPRLLFSTPGLALQEFYRTYDVHPDGRRFLMVTSGGADAPQLDVIFNWRTELEALKGATR